MKFVSTSLKTKLASLNKANLYYLSQTSQNNFSKIFLWKSHFANITGRKTNESLNCFASLGSKKKYHPRIQTFFLKKLKWSFFVTYYANLSGTFPKIARKKTALSITMSLIAGRYSQNPIGAEWSHQLVLPKRGSYNQNEILFGVQMVNSWIKACRTSRLVSCQA